MRQTLIFFFIIISIVVFSQSTQNLDAKNGFRHFKFGSSPSQIKNLVLNKNQYSKNKYVSEYEYVGNDITFIANVKVTGISLNFFKNQLFSVNVSFGDSKSQTDFSYKEYSNVFDWLLQAYGNNWVSADNDDGIFLNSAIWDGNKIRLELFRIDFSKSFTNPQNYGFISGYINVFDKNLIDKMYKSEF